MQRPTPSPGGAQGAPIPLWAFLGAIALTVIAFHHKVLFGIGSFWEDLVYQDFPFRVFGRDAIQSFSVPFWNPYASAGTPFFAAMNTAFLYPTNVLLSILPLGNSALWYAYEASLVLHVFLAGITMFFLCMQQALSRIASLGAAIGYMLCGFVVVHIIHSNMVFTLAWLPLLTMLVMRGVKNDRPVDFVLAGLVMGVSILAGHPQLAFYELLFVGALGAYLLSAISSKRAKHAALLASVFCIGCGLAAVQLLPALELSRQSTRANWTFLAASEGSMSFRQLLTLVVPKLFGGTTSPNPWRHELSFWLNDSVRSGFWTFWETTSYAGIALLVLGLVQLFNVRRSRFALFAALWLAFCVLVALGSHTPVYKLLFNYVPGFNRFRSPARILLTGNLLLPLLAAQTIDDLADPNERRRLLMPLVVVASGALVVGLSVISGAIEVIVPELVNETYGAYAMKQGALSVVFVLSGALVTAAFYRSIITERLFKSLMVAAIVADLFVFGMDYHVVPYSAPDYFARNRQLADVLRRESGKELFRMSMRASGIMLLERNQGMLGKFQLMEGYNPLNLERRAVAFAPQTLFDLFNVKYAVTVDGRTGQGGIVENATFLPRARMFYDVRILPSDAAVREYVQSSAFDCHRELVLSEQPSIPIRGGEPPPQSEVAVTRYAENRIELSATTERAGMLWLSEIWYPAWKAYVDGKPAKIYPADYSFRAVEMPAGRHTVVFEYESAAFRVGSVISICALLAAAGATLGMRKKRNAALGG